MTRPRPRLLAAVALLALLAVSGGCLSLLGGTVDSGSLNEAPEEPYDWDTRADGTIDIRKTSYRSIYNVTGEELPVYSRDALGLDEPVSIYALRYRYDNGTVIKPADHPAFEVSESRDGLTIHLPEPGQVAFTAPKQGNTVGVPVYLEGGEEPPSYEVIIPPGTDVAVPLLSNVQPGGYTTEDVDGRVHIYWEEMTTGGLSVRFYLDRDLYVFGSILGVGLIVGLIGAGYYLLQIRELVKRREDVGLDVDVDDDSRDPPPGMG